MTTKLRKLARTPLEGRVSAEEWEVRVNLAACYRLSAHFRMTDLIYTHISDDYEGLALELDEQARLTRDLGSHKAMILRNHGLLTCGASIPETFDYMYYLERACQTQINALAGGAKLRIPAPAVAEKVAAQFKALPYKPQRPEWKAHLRMLDKMDPSYKN